jgi:hypothetical protein
MKMLTKCLDRAQGVGQSIRDAALLIKGLKSLNASKDTQHFQRSLMLR